VWPELRLERLSETEIWVAWVRLAGLAFALLEVGLLSPHAPPGYETAAWATTGIFGAGTLVLFPLARVRGRAIVAVGVGALSFDTLVLCTFATIYSYEWGSPTRWVLFLAVVEAALRFGLAGGAGLAIVLVPFFWFVEWWRARHFGPPGFLDDRVSFPAGMHLLAGLVVGWLVGRLEREAATADARAGEAEELRDQLGRRVDVLEAANRCARALGSSLDLEQAFGTFIRELEGLVPFDRTAIVLVEGDHARTIATAGLGANDVYPPGATGPLQGSVLEKVVGGHTVVRGDIGEARYDADPHLAALGLHSEVVAPLLVGARAIGMLSVSRTQPHAFGPEEVELVTLLGRLVATGVQNIRSYQAERRTVDELRRLSSLRADFVSLVSHELRSPMAAVIGSARTLQQRWRQLAPEQRDAFVALIADETQRLATLISDVLDTSRIEAGTFSYTFADVDVTDVLREAVAAAEVAQDEVRVRLSVNGSVPRVRGDRARLRQVLSNLIDNAIKYSPAGSEVEISARRADGGVTIDVRDQGPGISGEQQGLIFEKFGRVQVDGGGKPGTGLGLFIARSIAEAHGGELDVDSTSGRGATFTLTLPVD
jgi:signal transduction histidine kinase